MTDRKVTCVACKSAVTKGDIEQSDLEFGGELKATNQPEYSAGADTDLVATIGTLDEYTPMVRTTGNQPIAGAKTHINGLMGQFSSLGIPASGTYTVEISYEGNTTQFADIEIIDYINNQSSVKWDLFMVWNGGASAKVYGRRLGNTNAPAPKFLVDGTTFKIVYTGTSYHTVMVNVKNARSWQDNMLVSINRVENPDYSGLTLQDVVEQ